MLKHALGLARRGLYVFPCRPRDKVPATAHGCRDATVDPALIETWWRQDNFNIGIATGRRSHVFVLDVDDNDVDDPAANLHQLDAAPGEPPPVAAAGPRGEAALDKLKEQYGKLPPTVEVITARGRHLYFEWPDRPVRNSAGKLGPGLDIRGEGGYVLAPPSIHPLGRAYCWSVDCHDAFAHAPQWLLDNIIEPANGNGHDAATPPAEWRELLRNGIEEGARNDTVTRLTGYLLRKRVDAVVAQEIIRSLNLTHCRPPLGDTELAGIVDSIAGRELRRRER
jgi:hypothetical protein